MKLMHPLFSKPISFKEKRIQVLTIEHAPTFRELVFELIAQMEDETGRFVLSKDERLLDCGVYLHVILDYAHLDRVEKKIQSKLISALLAEAQEEMAEDTMLFTQGVQRYLGKLAALADYPVAYEQGDNLAALLKAMDFRVDLSGLSAHEALYEYISLCHCVLKNPCFVLVQAKSFFSRDELRQVYDMARYKKWNLVLLESHQFSERLEGEEHRLIDEDLCELMIEKDEYNM